MIRYGTKVYDIDMSVMIRYGTKIYGGDTLKMACNVFAATQRSLETYEVFAQGMQYSRRF